MMRETMPRYTSPDPPPVTFPLSDNKPKGKDKNRIGIKHYKMRKTF